MIYVVDKAAYQRLREAEARILDLQNEVPLTRWAPIRTVPAHPRYL
jgi:hypothetical protein